MTVPFEIFANGDALARHAAAWLLGLAQSKQDRFALCLSGGSTPRTLYELLAAPPYRDTFPWTRTHLFWGDERFVPHADPLSNYRMTREAMLDRVPISAANIHPVPTEGLTPDAAAAAYDAELRAYHARDPDQPLFDVVLLGLGTDGHTASLFPGSPALKEQERLAVAVVGTRPESRITLTYPALQSSRHVAFLVTGADKRPVFERIAAGSDDPAARVRSGGDLHWFVDRAAAP